MGGWSDPGSRPGRASSTSKAWWRSSQATIKGDEAQIDTARVNLGYTNIRSPIDGRLGARLVDVGNLVRATDNTPLVSITQIKPIFVSFTLPQDELDQIRQQQQKAPLEVTALASDGHHRARRGQAHPDRQHDRPDHRHDPSEGDVPQRG